MFFLPPAEKSTFCSLSSTFLLYCYYNTTVLKNSMNFVGKKNPSLHEKENH